MINPNVRVFNGGARKIMSMQLTNHQGDLENIKALLKRRFLPEHRELKEFSLQLEKIDLSLSKALKNPHASCKKNLEKQKELVNTLTGRCHQLEIRRNVVMLAEDAEHLANTSPDRPQEEIASSANLLRTRIEDFLLLHRPSKTNTKFIRFARACLVKAEKKEPVLVRGSDGRMRKVISIESFKSKHVTLEMFDLAENLYSLAKELYAENFDIFSQTLEQSFSDETKKEIRFHISVAKGDLKNLQNKETRLRTIQGILGYAHDLTDYYMDDSPYPGFTEIHSLFRDLDLINHIEAEDPSLQESQT